MGMYLDNGYLNVEYINSKNLPFNIVLSGRGTGKTYSVLENLLLSKTKFCFMRRSQTQLEDVVSSELSPFNRINIDHHWYNPYVGFSKSGKTVYTICDLHTDEESRKPIEGDSYGIGVALSSVVHLRGFSMPSIDAVLFDEFIPEPHEREVTDEGLAFFNALETIGRNRELEGRSPLKVYMLGNPNYFGGGIAVEMGLIGPLTYMIKKKINVYIDRKRGIGIWLLRDSPILTRKKDTALYKVASERYKNMAVESIFEDIFESGVVSRNLKEYTPLAQIGEIVVYIKKSRDKYYISSHKTGSPTVYPNTDSGWQKMSYAIPNLKLASLYDDVEYESNLLKMILTKRKIVV